MGEHDRQRTRNLVLGLVVLLVLTYVGGSVSIHTGNITANVLTALLAYLALRCGIQLIKSVFHHDKTSRTRRAQKAH